MTGPARELATGRRAAGALGLSKRSGDFQQCPTSTPQPRPFLFGHQSKQRPKRIGGAHDLDNNLLRQPRQHSNSISNPSHFTCSALTLVNSRHPSDNHHHHHIANLVDHHLPFLDQLYQCFEYSCCDSFFSIIALEFLAFRIALPFPKPVC